MKKKLMMLLFVVLSIFSFAKGYPSKNINLVVPFAAGGGTDAVARKLGSLLEKELGQPVIIVNRTGGAGAVGMTYGSTSKRTVCSTRFEWRTDVTGYDFICR